MAQFLERKTQYVRITDTSGSTLTSTSNALNVNVVNPSQVSTAVSVFSTPTFGNGDMKVLTGPDVSTSSTDTSSCTNVAIFGRATGVTGSNPGLAILVSQNDLSFFDTGSIISLKVGNGDFYGEASVPTRYIKIATLPSPEFIAGTVNVTVAGKI
jgi:hypothetical protein